MLQKCLILTTSVVDRVFLLATPIEHTMCKVLSMSTHFMHQCVWGICSRELDYCSDHTKQKSIILVYLSVCINVMYFFNLHYAGFIEHGIICELNITSLIKV